MSVSERDAEMRRLGRNRTDRGSGVRDLWRKWGPYLSERQWGTVREDYSDNGDAWNYFTHEQARSRAYRWGEDGLGGICDDRQLVCFAIALWNGRDPILKERPFGLTNAEGNHGEDVKEYYFYLDSTPTHSYMRYLYKYPQRAFPYADLVATNRKRSRLEQEYELLDTGIFAENRYFDVFVEYAKAEPEDILIRITLANRGPEAAPIHVLPTLWFRNTWSWGDNGSKPALRSVEGAIHKSIRAQWGDPHPEASLEDCTLACDGAPALLFTENETNSARLFGTPNASRYVKDSINDYIVQGAREAVNPEQRGTKASAHYMLSVDAGASAVAKLRLISPSSSGTEQPFGPSFDDVFATRQREADEYFRSLNPPGMRKEEAAIVRQALSGMLWGKQYYCYEGDRWLEQHHVPPLQAAAGQTRNRDWYHMVNGHVISMPDKWEYPWYAAWDLAFHAIALSVADPELAKQQLELMLCESYLHPSGQIPAYEWNFSDVNPPVHAWATLFVYQLDNMLRGQADPEFLKRSFSKLLLNFTWWINRKDRFGKNVFEGGFLGMDNIGVFDRSSALPTGGCLEQADATAWMSFFCQNMIDMSVELTFYDRSYESMCAKFVEHFLWIAAGMNRLGADGMWDEQDGFYFDILRLPDGSAQRLRVRSMVGLLPICATTVIERWQLERVPGVIETWRNRVKRMPELLDNIHPVGADHVGAHGRTILALVNRERLHRILTRVLDENEFLSPYGIRSLSRYHLGSPFAFNVHGEALEVGYLPAESDSGMFGGNSNWRGPIWMPVNGLIIRGLLNYYLYYGDSFKIECPTGSGRLMNLFEVGREIARRLTRIFLPDETGRRPVYGGTEKFQTDPHWRDHILFYEYFHGDNGAGLGASHQTGWTGLIAVLIELFSQLDAAQYLAAGRRGFSKTAGSAGAAASA